jgi:hypothetical protein
MKTFLMALSIASSLLVTRLHAQSPYRADLLKQERAAGIEEATPPQRTTIERGMNFLEKAREGFERLMGDENGWHYSSGDFPAGAGIRPGVAYSHDGKWVDGYAEPDRPNRLIFNWNAAYTTREYYQTALKTQLLNIGGSIFNVGLHGKYFEHPEDDFFGIGPDTRKEDRTNYLYRSLEGGGAAWLSPIRGFRAGGGVSYLSPSVGSGRDSRFPSLEQVFDPSTVPGFDEPLPDFLRVDAFVD